MSVKKTFFVVSLSILLSGIALPGLSGPRTYAQSTDSRTAVQRGYRAGYSDGYMAGYRDIIDSLSKDISRHTDYVKADRAYSKDYGSLQDYRDGYQQGFETGYGTGFDRRSFEAALPADLKTRGGNSNAGAKELMAATKPAETQPAQVAATNTSGETKTTEEPVAAAKAVEEPPAAANTAEEVNADAKTAVEPQPAEQAETGGDTAPATSSATAQYQAPAGEPVVIIPRDIELILELQDELNTEQSREGQKFTAKVTSPSEIAGATVEGRVTKSRRPGRLNRRSELLLSFDRILLNDNRWSNFSATLVEVVPVKGDNISKVDEEGTAIGQSTFKPDVIKVGGATGAGLIVGAIAGGPVGAAVGAGVGAAFGVGAVVIDRGKHVRLNRNQQMRVRTEYETQIR